MSITIEKNVPMKRRGKADLYPWDEMEVGDSFLFPEGYQQNSAYRLAAQASLRNGKKYEAHKTEGGMRCWRVE